MLLTKLVLLIIATSLWFLLRPKRDWYVIEWRTRSDERHTLRPPPYSGFSKFELVAHKFRIESLSKSFASLLHQEGTRITIKQAVFEDLLAAQHHFERTKALFPYSDTYQKLYLLRVVARSRRRAHVLPPRKYIDFSTEVLDEYPLHLWFEPQKVPPDQ